MFCLFAGASFAQVPTNGLVGYYPFNGNAEDLSINGNNGVVNGAVLTEDRFGNPSSAYQFNGSSNIYAYNTKGLKNNSYTYSFWMNNAESPALEGLSSIIELGSNVDYGLLFNLTNNYFSTTGWASASNDQSFHSGVLPLTNAWYHVLVTKNDTSLVTYVNNVPLSIMASTGKTYYACTNNLYIGSRANLQAGQFFKGKVDDLRFYNRVLNQNEIAALYTENNCTQLIARTDTLIIKINTNGLSNNHNFNLIKVYPNPTNNDSQITVDFGNYALMAGFKIKINNEIGQTVYDKAIEEALSVITLVNKGLFYMTIIDQNGNTIGVKKIVVQ